MKKVRGCPYNASGYNDHRRLVLQHRAAFIMQFLRDIIPDFCTFHAKMGKINGNRGL